MISSSQTTLAKLLAKENIEVQHGNFRTAFFDVEKRILGLPLWKDRGKDVYDLLTGHEVGHALYTPPEGWHDSTSEVPGIPRSYVNVIEDVRIEKLVQRQYPGLVASFKRGYKVLHKEDFFQVAGTDLSSRNLVDRINLKAKCRDLVEVTYSAEEQPIVNQVMAVETWEDVIEACKALYSFMKDQQEQNEQNQDPIEMDFSDHEDEVSDDSDTDSTESDSEEASSDSEELDENEVSQSGRNEEATESVSKDENTDIDRVLTDEAFRNNEHKLLDTNVSGEQSLYANGINREQLNRMVIPYADVKAARESNVHYNRAMTTSECHGSDTVNDDIAKFEQDTKSIVSIMSKEFEMRKAAYRLQRAQTSRSGAINVNKLHSYKFNDDIFARITNLADAKSHGMVMFIDYSGSMSRVIGKVIRQTLTLVDFCSKVNIPFAVYGFTSQNTICGVTEFPGNVYDCTTGVFELISSSLNRAEIKNAREVLLRQSMDLDYSYRTPLMSRFEDLGSTPLFETILCAEYIITDFKAKHNIQKVNAVFLTDGDGDSLQTYSNGVAQDNIVPSSTWRNGYSIRMNSGLVKAQDRYDLGPALLTQLKKTPGVTTIGFYVCTDAYGWKNQMYRAHRNNPCSSDMMATARKSYNSNKFISLDDKLGYDKYFLLNGKALNTNTEELSLDTDHAASATKAQITKAFKKHTSSKKGNKVLATQFATLVA
jgi:hypothetical protein